jgi:Family of unknown function (DUF5320)
MPKRNGTGPYGHGPLTGRGDGRCILPLNTGDEEIVFLKNREQVIEKQAQNIRDRIQQHTGIQSTGDKN